MNNKIVLCAVSMVGLLAVGCSGAHQSEVPAAAPEAGSQRMSETITLAPDSPKYRQIRISQVQMAHLPGEEIVSPGRIEVNPNRVSRVVLPVPGKLARVLAKLGDRVTAGQTLLELESPDVEAAMSAYLQAESGVTQSKAVLVKAQRDQERAADLYSHKAIAQKEVLSAESTLAQAKAGLEQAEAQREQVLRKLQLLGLKPGVFGQRLVVTAPSSGIVLEMNAAPGEYRNDISAPLMTIADLSTVWVTANVQENYIRLIRPGGQVKISLLAFPGEIFEGRVRRIADTVDPQTRTLKVMIELLNSEGRFRPEMYGEIRYIASVRELPAIPAGAVIQTEDGPAVFIERSPGNFIRTPIKIGQRTEDQLPVLSGVKPGDRIVTDGVMLLKAQ
jgi:membrane fusion protein, heavy metal efflux system